MDSRRLPLLLLVVLLPAPALADRHTVECFGGFSPEKQQAVAARLACGFRLLGLKVNDGEVQTPVGDLRQGAPRLRAATDTGAAGTGTNGGRKPTKGSLFLVGEVAEYIAGTDSGDTVDGWMVGLRYSFRGQGTIEPFVHAMGGSQFQEGSDTTGGVGSATSATVVSEHDGIAAFGGGVDLEISPSSTAFIVPVLRLQVDLIKSWAPGVDPYARATFGVSLRFEGHGHK